jgi:hypothetical protein
MHYMLVGALMVFGILIGILLSLEAGRRIGLHRLNQGAKSAGSPALEGAVFGLLGLLIAFTFSGAAERFDVRRQLIVEEANAIGTAYLRIELLPPENQPEMRRLFRQYVDSRLEVYEKLPDVEAARAQLNISNELQNQIWSAAVSASQRTGTTSASMLLLPALNEMIDITTTRTVAAQTHPPDIIYAMLIALALGCSFMAGYGMSEESKHSRIHVIAFALIMTFAVYVILDLEYPRMGFIRITAVDQVLRDVRNTMR